MNVYVPYTQITAATTVNTGIGNLNLFPTLMAQNGLSLYNDERNATDLNSKAAIEVFDFWTDLYTEYGYLKEAEFYNRFRVGVVPLGIAPLATYMNLYSAAPEIAGRWSVGLVPASDNGSRAIAGAGTGCGIISKSDNKEEAWEFLKWWTSAETQTRYNNNVESILGMIGRTTTANVEAFQNLAWDKDHLEVMEQQRLQVKEVPEVPGSYYLSRAIDQAYWSVVNGECNSKDAVMKWCKIADEEMTALLRKTCDLTLESLVECSCRRILELLRLHRRNGSRYGTFLAYSVGYDDSIFDIHSFRLHNDIVIECLDRRNHDLIVKETDA